MIIGLEQKNWSLIEYVKLGPQTMWSGSRCINIYLCIYRVTLVCFSFLTLLCFGVGLLGFFPLESAATDKSDQQCLQYESVFETWRANTGEQNST